MNVDSAFAAAFSLFDGLQNPEGLNGHWYMGVAAPAITWEDASSQA